MKVNVGSENPTKVGAVKNVLGKSAKFKHAKVTSLKVDIEEFGHPKSLEETIDGAITRAKQAYKDCDLSIGIEGGLIRVPRSKTNYMENTVCAIYDGQQIHLGLGPGFEWPQQVIDLLFAGRDGSQAFKELGITDHPKLGTAGGAIEILSNGLATRTDLNEVAVTMALVHLEHPEHY